MSFHRACCCSDDTCPASVQLTFTGITACACVDTGGGSSYISDASTLNGVYTLSRVNPPVTTSPASECQYRLAIIDQFETDTWDNVDDCSGGPADTTRTGDVDIIAFYSSGTWYVAMSGSVETTAYYGFYGSSAGNLVDNTVISSDIAVGDCGIGALDPPFWAILPGGLTYGGSVTIDPA